MIRPRPVSEQWSMTQGSVYVTPAGMSSLKNIGKSDITIFTVVLKPE